MEGALFSLAMVRPFISALWNRKGVLLTLVRTMRLTFLFVLFCSMPQGTSICTDSGYQGYRDNIA